jgi:ABC-2 type transport system permease protein
MDKEKKDYQYHPFQKYYKFILYFIVVVLINVVGITLFFRADLTSNGLYSLSKASKEVVSSLKAPLTVNVFFSKNLPPPYNNIELYLHDLLAEYEIYSNRNLSYRFYDVTASEGDVNPEAEENRKIAQSYGIYPVSVQKFEQDETKVQRAYMGIALIHGDLVEKIPAVTSTDRLEYSITSAVRKMVDKISALQSLQEKIKVTLVLSSSLSQIARWINLEGIRDLKDRIGQVVDRLNGKNFGRLEFVHIDPSMGEGNPAQLEEYEKRYVLEWPQLTAPDGTIIPAGKGMIVVFMSYGAKAIERGLLSQVLAPTPQGLRRQYVIESMENIERFINDNIENLIDIHEDLGYLSSHGAPSLMRSYMPEQQMLPQKPETLMRFNELLSREYTVKEITLENEIPESIDTLIIAGPKSNFNDWELFQIDQFLMKGKSLAIFLDAFREIQPQQRGGFQQPVYLPINTGLEKLLDHYGLKVKKSYLLDENCFINRGRNTDDMPIYFAPIIQNEKINHSLKFMENLKQLIVIKSSPLEADNEKIKRNDLKLEEVFASSDKSWEMSGRINLMPFMIQPPTDEKQKKSQPLAYLLEGEFPGYFADKPVPEKPKKEENKAEEGGAEKKEAGKPEEVKPDVPVTKARGVLSRGKPGKIFLIGTAEILKDNALDEEGVSTNAVFLMNTLDYLNNREDNAVMRGKNQWFNPLKSDIKPAARTRVKIFNIGGLPALFILFGIMVWIYRNARKKRIQAMFISTNNK